MSDHPWPHEGLILRQSARVEAGVAGANWRHWTLFDFSQCTHEEQNVMVQAGDWEVEVCTRCGAGRKACNHTNMVWNEAGTLLRCANCGIDGT